MCVMRQVFCVYMRCIRADRKHFRDKHGENVYKMTTVTNRVWVNADKDSGVCNDPDVNMRYIDIFKAYEK